jgi:hypothetical protein
VKRWVAFLAIGVVAALGVAAAVWATQSGSDCETTSVSVADPGSPRTMKVLRQDC